MFGLRKRTWAIGGIVAALLGTAALAMHSHSPEDRAKWATERISDRLDLDDTQKDAFSKVADSYVQIRGTAPEFMLDLSSKLKELAVDDTLTVEEVNELRDQIKAEFDRRAEMLVPEFVAFYNTLDDTQRATVMERLDKLTSRIEHRFDRNKSE